MESTGSRGLEPVEGELWKAILRLVIFLPLVLLLAYWSIRIGASRGQMWQGSRNLRVVERIALGPKSGLCIVKVGQEYYLMGISEQRIELLKELPHYEEQETPTLRGSWPVRRSPWSKE